MKMPTPPESLLREGAFYRGFRLVRLAPVEELQLQLLELVHEATGACVMHLLADDPENLFCLSFQTRPTSSNGVAHILEHLVLCGSERYPLHDPFFCMLRRSLHTFMNAMTGADFTCYPAASQIKQDFYHLLDVYLDAVFFPKLDRYSFMQEGHRLEWSEEEKQLLLSGVVYNEMKGAMNSPNSRLMEKLDELLYPTLTYGHNSGGRPADILQLTHEELLAFHRDYYHPSRCLFYFYGNWSTCDHLDFLADKLLEKSEQLAPLPAMPREERFTTPRSATISYPASAGETPEEESMVAIGWLGCHILEQEQLLALALLDGILMENDGSLLKRPLLDSKLCKQASFYVDDDNAEVPLVLVMKGCSSESGPALEQLVVDSLRQIVAKGLDPVSIERALHQLEFGRTEIGSCFGLDLFMRAALPKQHGADPLDSLSIHRLFERLRCRLRQEERFLESLISHYLIDNGHRVRVTALPDSRLLEKESEAERSKLKEQEASFDPIAKKALLEEMAHFSAFQQAQEEQDREILPKLAIEEVPLSSRDYPLLHGHDCGVDLFFHDSFTNGIVYAAYLLPLPKLNEAELPQVTLLLGLMNQLGAGKRTFIETLDYQQAHVGSIAASLALHGNSRDPSAIEPSLLLGGKALYRHRQQLFELMREMTQEIQWEDQPRIEELLRKQWTALQSRLTQSGMHYARNLASKGFSTAGHLAYFCNGLGYYHAMKELVQALPERIEPLIAQLKALHKRLFHGNSAHIVVGCDEGCYRELQQEQFYGLEKLPKKPFLPFDTADYPLEKSFSQGRIIASPVAFTNGLLPAVPYCHKAAPALCAAGMLMDNVVLHRKLREEGGAYGSGAFCKPMNGLFHLYGYRDPHICSTIETFRQAIELVADGDFDGELLYEAQLELLQDLDAPVAPGDRAAAAYSWWREAKPWSVRQQFRQRLLALTEEEVIEAVSTHLKANLDQMVVVSFGGEELLLRENSAMEAAGAASLPVYAI